MYPAWYFHTKSDMEAMAIEIDIYSGFDHENSMVMIKMVIFPSVFCNVYVNVDQRKTLFGDGDFGV